MSRMSKPQIGFVYLAHFAANLHHARHYLGFCTDLAQRLAQHRAGTGARLRARHEITVANPCQPQLL